MSVRIQVTEYFIQLIASSTDVDFLNLVDKMPGIEKTRKKDTYQCSIRKLPEVLQILRGITIDDHIPNEKIRKLYVDEMRRRWYTPLLKEHGPTLTSDFLWPHQCLGVELAQVNNRYNFFYDTRTGKTLMCLQIMYDRLKNGIDKKCLVICPSNIIQSWVNDAKRFPELKIAAYYGSPNQRKEALSTPAHIVIWAANHVAKNIELLSSGIFSTCIFDESSKIKNHSTEIAKAARKLSLTIPSWYNLSATPAPNGEHEYYTQMMCLDPCVFSSARTKFVTKYFDNVSRSPQFEKLAIKDNMREAFMDIIQSYSLYVDQKVMPTAGKEWHEVYFELSREEADLYNEMRTTMVTEIQGIKIAADMAAAMRAKLNQISSGFVMDTEARKLNAINRKLVLDTDACEVYRTETRTRISCLANLLSELDERGAGKVVIWANYAEEFRMLYELLGDSARYVRGGTSIEDKERYIYSDFKSGEAKYLVCHPLSVGMGINLTEAHVAIYYSLNDSWEAFKQSSERIYGHINVQPNVCEYYVLMARGTVNELIYKNLLNKRDVSTGFLEHLKAAAL